MRRRMVRVKGSVKKSRMRRAVVVMRQSVCGEGRRRRVAAWRLWWVITAVAVERANESRSIMRRAAVRLAMLKRENEKEAMEKNDGVEAKKEKRREKAKTESEEVGDVVRRCGLALFFYCFFLARLPAWVALTRVACRRGEAGVLRVPP